MSKRDSIISMFGAAVIDKDIYFYNKTCGRLFRANLDQKKITVFSLMPTILGRVEEYKYVFFSNDKLFFVPAKETRICVYDIKKGAVSIIPLGEGDVERFSGIIFADNKLFMFPFLTTQDLISLDMRDMQVKKEKQFKQAILEFSTTEAVLMTRVSLLEDKIVFAIYNSSYLGIWDFKKNQLNTIDMGVENIFAAKCVNDNIWIIPMTGDFIGKYDPYENKVEKIIISRPEYANKSETRPCNDIIGFDGKVFLVPFRSPDIYVYKGHCFCKIGEVDECAGEVLGFGTITVEDELWFLPFCRSGIILCVGKDLQTRYINLNEFDCRAGEVMKQVMVQNGGTIIENDSDDLANYLFSIVMKK